MYHAHLLCLIDVDPCFDYDTLPTPWKALYIRNLPRFHEYHNDRLDTEHYVQTTCQYNSYENYEYND